MIKTITKSRVNPIYGPNRKGDILFSLADINFAQKILNYNPYADLFKQMELTIEDYKERYLN
jgi:UDP-N-acetylglucosamine 4-epimerase